MDEECRVETCDEEQAASAEAEPMTEAERSEAPFSEEPLSEEPLSEEPKDVSDAMPDEKTDGPEDEVALLRNEVERLRLELVRRERLDAEWQEFCALYPDVEAETVPDTVWEKVKQGLPLAAAYALHERRRLCRERAAEEVNRENARRSSGSMRTAGEEEFYSPEEVRAMGAREVRSKYGRILESMKRWG
jgi:hypothetical protein